jgi:hypothetical protein
MPDHVRGTEPDNSPHEKKVPSQPGEAIGPGQMHFNPQESFDAPIEMPLKGDKAPRRANLHSQAPASPTSELLRRHKDSKR